MSERENNVSSDSISGFVLVTDPGSCDGVRFWKDGKVCWRNGGGLVWVWVDRGFYVAGGTFK